MLFYVFIGLLVLSISLPASYFSRGKLLFSLPLITLLAYFISFRDLSIGTDTLRYHEIFLDIRTLTDAISTGNFGFEAKRIEIGFVFLSSIFKEFSLDFHSLLFLLNFCTFLILFLSFSELSKNHGPILFFLYTCTFTFITLQYNIVRQGIAVAICVLAFVQLGKGSNWRYFFLSFFAFLFHSISILFLCIWPFRNLKWKALYVVPFILVFLIVANVNFLTVIVDLLSPYSTSVWRVANYMLTKAGETKLFSIAILLDFFLITYCIMDAQFLRGRAKYFDIALTSFVIGFVGMAALHELNLLSLRFFFLFTPYEVYLFYAMFSRLKSQLIIKDLIICGLGFVWLLKNLYITAQFITFY